MRYNSLEVKSRSVSIPTLCRHSRIRNAVKRRIVGYLSMLWIAVLSAGCGLSMPSLDPDAPTPTPTLLSQWAASAEASSQYGLPDWSAARALGPPDVETCTDDPRAWASLRGNGVEWLTLTFPEPVQASEVRVHQSFGRGAVSRITLIDLDGDAHVVWEGTDPEDPCPGMLVVKMPLTDYATQTVRVDLDESRTDYWNQIDAVELTGTVVR